MNLGEKLYNLRKNKNLSQEEVANKLNVTRQTVSKWETGESKPDFDKIIPICELYGVSSDELLGGSEILPGQESLKKETAQVPYKKRALIIASSIFLYFLGIIAIIAFSELGLNEVFGVCVFLALSGIATCALVYQGIVFSKAETNEDKMTTNEGKVENKKVKRICHITELITVVLYLIISFATMAWHITWIIFLIECVVEEIIKLIFDMEDKEDDE